MPASVFDTDLDAFFASSDFGEAEGTATWEGTEVSGIFDDDDVEVQMGEGPTEIIPQPTFTSKTASFTGIADGDSMTIRGENFTIKNWMVEDEVITVFLSRGN